MFWMIIILSLFSASNSVSIGKIEDYMMISVINNSILNITEDECICQMIKSNDSISALNYFPINQTCQLFYLNASSILIEFYLNSSFIFINQSSILITNSKFILDKFRSFS